MSRSLAAVFAVVVALGSLGVTRVAAEERPIPTPVPAASDNPVIAGYPCETGITGETFGGEAMWPAPYGQILCDDCNRLRFPTLYVWAEALVLTRDNDASDRALVLDLNTDEVLLSVGDLDFDWSGGLRAGIACREYGCWGVEFAYLGYFDQLAQNGVASDDDLVLPGPLGLAVNNFFGADDVSVSYTSDLQSGEINVIRSCVGCERSLEWLAGFRYLYYGEGFGIRAYDSAESTTNYNVGTDNNLFGGQVGARAYRRVGSLAGEATTKAGVYGNYMEQSAARIVDFPDFEFRPARSSDGGDVAFVGDLNVSAIYQLTEVWGLRAGYNVIWIEGVALAPDQLDFSNNANSGRRLVSDGSVLLHGINAGIEARW